MGLGPGGQGTGCSEPDFAGWLQLTHPTPTPGPQSLSSGLQKPHQGPWGEVPAGAGSISPGNALGWPRTGEATEHQLAFLRHRPRHSCTPGLPAPCSGTALAGGICQHPPAKVQDPSRSMSPWGPRLGRGQHGKAHVPPACTRPRSFLEQLQTGLLVPGSCSGPFPALPLALGRTLPQAHVWPLMFSRGKALLRGHTETPLPRFAILPPWHSMDHPISHHKATNSVYRPLVHIQSPFSQGRGSPWNPSCVKNKVLHPVACHQKGKGTDTPMKTWTTAQHSTTSQRQPQVHPGWSPLCHITTAAAVLCKLIPKCGTHKILANNTDPTCLEMFPVLL